MKMRIAIVEDEPLVRRSIRRFLMQHDLEIVGECHTGRIAVDMIRKEKPDIVLLDVQIPEMDGMQVFKAVGEESMPTTVIVTAHQEYAIRAFDLRVADYLLKPFGKDRFAKAIQRACQMAELRKQQPLHPATVEPNARTLSNHAFQKRIAVTSRNGRFTFIDVSQIEWIEAEGNLLSIHTESSAVAIRETLTSLLSRLDPALFIRIHRSTIVNLAYVREVEPWTNGHHLVILRSGRTLRMSRYQRESLQRMIGRRA